MLSRSSRTRCKIVPLVFRACNTHKFRWEVICRHQFRTSCTQCDEGCAPSHHCSQPTTGLFVARLLQHAAERSSRCLAVPSLPPAASRINEFCPLICPLPRVWLTFKNGKSSVSDLKVRHEATRSRHYYWPRALNERTFISALQGAPTAALPPSSPRLGAAPTPPTVDTAQSAPRGRHTSTARRLGSPTGTPPPGHPPRGAGASSGTAAKPDWLGAPSIIPPALATAGLVLSPPHHRGAGLTRRPSPLWGRGRERCASGRLRAPRLCLGTSRRSPSPRCEQPGPPPCGRGEGGSCWRAIPGARQAGAEPPPPRRFCRISPRRAELCPSRRPLPQSFHLHPAACFMFFYCLFFFFSSPPHLRFSSRPRAKCLHERRGCPGSTTRGLKSVVASNISSSASMSSSGWVGATPGLAPRRSRRLRGARARLARDRWARGGLGGGRGPPRPSR